MSQGCLKCLKLTMCAANLLCFTCGVAVFVFGVYVMVNFKMIELTPNLYSQNFANLLVISGIVITCVSFLGFLGALKENRCLLLTFFLLLLILMLVELSVAGLLLVYEKEIGKLLKDDLVSGLKNAKGKTGNSTELISDWDVVQTRFSCCGVDNVLDWGDQIPPSCCSDNCNTTKPAYKEGCHVKILDFFEKHFLTTGMCVIALSIVEVLGMCFAMTLFCHISRSGLSYKI